MKSFNKKLILLLSMGMLFSTACGMFDKDEDEQPNNDPAQQIGIAANDPDLMILVSYVDTTTYVNPITLIPKRITRLKLVSEAEFISSSGYRFLGRAYSKNTPGKNGFGIALNEYYAPFGSPTTPTWGFRYLMGVKCVPSLSGYPCQSDAITDPSKVDPDAVAYVAPPQADFDRGIVPLYEYWTIGGAMSSGSGNVNFTVDEREIIGLQEVGVPVSFKYIGAVYHGTQSDCQANRSVFCDVNR